MIKPIPCIPICERTSVWHKAETKTEPAIVMFLATYEQDPIDCILDYWFVPGWSM